MRSISFLLPPINPNRVPRLQILLQGSENRDKPVLARILFYIGIPSHFLRVEPRVVPAFNALQMEPTVK